MLNENLQLKWCLMYALNLSSSFAIRQRLRDRTGLGTKKILHNTLELVSHVL